MAEADAESAEVAELKELLRRPPHSARLPAEFSTEGAAFDTVVEQVMMQILTRVLAEEQWRLIVVDAVEELSVEAAKRAGLGPLVALADAGTEGEREKVAAAIASLACNDEQRVAITNAGGLDAMIRLANSGRLTEPMRISEKLATARDTAVAKAEGAAVLAEEAKKADEARAKEAAQASAEATAAEEALGTALDAVAAAQADPVAEDKAAAAAVAAKATAESAAMAAAAALLAAEAQLQVTELAVAEAVADAVDEEARARAVEIEALNLEVMTTATAAAMEHKSTKDLRKSASGVLTISWSESKAKELQREADKLASEALRAEANMNHRQAEEALKEVKAAVESAQKAASDAKEASEAKPALIKAEAAATRAAAARLASDDAARLAAAAKLASGLRLAAILKTSEAKAKVAREEQERAEAEAEAQKQALEKEKVEMKEAAKKESEGRKEAAAKELVAKKEAAEEEARQKNEEKKRIAAEKEKALLEKGSSATGALARAAWTLAKQKAAPVAALAAAKARDKAEELKELASEYKEQLLEQKDEYKDMVLDQAHTLKEKAVGVGVKTVGEKRLAAWHEAAEKKKASKAALKAAEEKAKAATVASFKARSEELSAAMAKAAKLAEEEAKAKAVVDEKADEEKAAYAEAKVALQVRITAETHVQGIAEDTRKMKKQSDARSASTAKAAEKAKAKAETAKQFEDWANELVTKKAATLKAEAPVPVPPKARVSGTSTALQVERASEAMGHLAVCTANKLLLARSGGIGVLRRLARAGQTDGQRRRAAGALRNLFHTLSLEALSPEAADELIGFGAIDTIVEHARASGELSICSRATEVLGMFANLFKAQPPDSSLRKRLAVAFLEGGGMPFLIDRMATASLPNGPGPAPSELAMDSLSPMAWDRGCALAVVKDGGLEVLVAIASTGTSRQQERCAAALCALASHADVADEHKNAGGLRALIAMSTTGSERQRQNAAGGVAMLSAHMAARREGRVSDAKAKYAQELVATMLPCA